jgi:hypothetical protein
LKQNFNVINTNPLPTPKSVTKQFRETDPAQLLIPNNYNRNTYVQHFNSAWGESGIPYQDIQEQSIEDVEHDDRLLLPLMVGQDKKTDGLIFVDIEGKIGLFRLYDDKFWLLADDFDFNAARNTVAMCGELAKFPKHGRWKLGAVKGEMRQRRELFSSGFLCS